MVLLSCFQLIIELNSQTDIIATLGISADTQYYFLANARNFESNRLIHETKFRVLSSPISVRAWVCFCYVLLPLNPTLLEFNARRIFFVSIKLNGDRAETRMELSKERTLLLSLQPYGGSQRCRNPKPNKTERQCNFFAHEIIINNPNYQYNF